MENVLEINYCLEGREECRLKSGSALYLGEGDLSVHGMDNCSPKMYFPCGHYRGISVLLHLDQITARLPELFVDKKAELLDFPRKFCADGRCFTICAREKTAQIFSGLASVPEVYQNSIFRLKVQELLLFLCMIDPAIERQKKTYTFQQVETIKAVHKKITSDLQERRTIEELSREFLMNSTTLKASFKNIYGDSIGAYMKKYRVRSACTLLRETEESIAEIAAKVGYENQSKFASAFRSVMQMPPGAWRKSITADSTYYKV